VALALGAIVDVAPVTAPAVATPATPPTIEAVEVERGRAYFAGAGTEGATVRLFVDGEFVGDSGVEEGRWLVEANEAIAAPTQHVRIDMLLPGSEIVVASTEANIVL